MNDTSAPEKPLWNTLEIAKIVVGILTPIAIFFFTYQTNKAQSKAADERSAVVRRETQERERFIQVTKQRIELWSAISPLMNDLYCYFLYVGHWKEISPEQVIATKRKLDKLIYSNMPFFSPEFLTKYSAFMSAAFRTGQGTVIKGRWGEDAKLKAPPVRPRDKGKERMFEMTENGYDENTDAIYVAYFAWLRDAAREMDLKVKAPPKPEQPSAGEIRVRLEKRR